MADPVVIVSVVSGAAVAVTVPLITSALERRRLREQVGESRIDELRAVLDEPAVALDRALRTLPTWEVLAKADTDTDHVAIYAESRTAVESVGTQERIAVRLGETQPDPEAASDFSEGRRQFRQAARDIVGPDCLVAHAGRAPMRVTPGEVPDDRAQVSATSRSN